MDFYDVHTHAPLVADEADPDPADRYSYILNVYPLGFEDAKDASLGCFFSCGVHPWYSEDADSQLKFLSEIAVDNRIIAIGEAGLDKLKGPSLVVQERVFEFQIQLSERLSKPLIIHCVKMWDELLALKKKYKPQQSWIIHGYRGKVGLTQQLISNGFMFSVGSKMNAESVKEIPLHKLLCETDVQNITIKEVYEQLSETLEMSLEELSEQVAANVKRVFPQFNE